MAVGEYTARLDPESAESKRFVVKEMTVAIGSQLKHLTVNAPDWYVAFYHEKTPCGVASMVMM